MPNPGAFFNQHQPQSPSYSLDPFQGYETTWNNYAGMSPYNYNVIDDWQNPFLSQYIEWSQQMVAQMYQNAWMSAPQQMQRGIEAGINPYLLANGIAGGNAAPSMSAPNSAIGSGSASFGALANGVAGVVQALNGHFGGAVSSFAQMYKLQHEVNNLDADTEKKFTEMGFTELQSKAMSISLKYLDQKEQVGVWLALANLDKTRQEYSNLHAQHRNIVSQYDEIIAKKDLLIAEKGEVDALKIVHQAEAERLKAVTAWQNIENNFFQSHGYKLGVPIYEGIRDSIVSGFTFDSRKYGDVITSYQGGLDKAYFDSQAVSSWKSRPSNAFEMSAFIGSSLGSGLRNIILKATDSSSMLDMLSKVSNKSEREEFEEAYDDARSELYSNYRNARKEYRKASRSSATEQYKQECLQRMQKAKHEYESFTKQKFSDSLISSLKPH